MTGKPDIVSDHALLRWLERAHGLPIEAFRDQLRKMVLEASKAGAASMQRDGLTFIFSHGTGRLVTVVVSDRKPVVRGGRGGR